VVDQVPDGGGPGDIGAVRQLQGLREVAEAAGGLDGDGAVDGCLPAREQPQQGGLAGSVVPDDADAFAGADGEGDTVEDEPVVDVPVVVALGDIGELDAEQGGLRGWTTRTRSWRPLRNETSRLAYAAHRTPAPGTPQEG
jgi:hypothetical protein